MIAYERRIFVLVLNTINKLCVNVRHVIVKVRVTVVKHDPGRLNSLPGCRLLIYITRSRLIDVPLYRYICGSFVLCLFIEVCEKSSECIKEWSIS